MPVAPSRRVLLQAMLLAATGGWRLARAAQGVELLVLQLHRADGRLTLDFSVRLTLPRAVEDALQRGVPVYFTAEATLRRHRWYWRDERVARARRSWRLAFQPLTATWRVALAGALAGSFGGALTQSFATLPEALAALSGTGGWAIADLAQLDPDDRYYVEFGYRLDTTQLPSPLQIGLPGNDEWDLRVEREEPLP
jgi:hypothetical protein